MRRSSARRARTACQPAAGRARHHGRSGDSARATDALVAERACFLVASKSGSTLEVTSLEAHFWSVMAVARRRRRAGTSSPSPTRARAWSRTRPPAAIATRSSTRRISAAGTRRSRSLAWCPRGCSASRGPRLLTPAADMAARCRDGRSRQPWPRARVFMGGHALAGRDKLTDPRVAVARAARRLDRTTRRRKHGQTRPRRAAGRRRTGRAPRPSTAPDRAFVVISESGDAHMAATARALAAAGHPMLTIETTPAQLGAEFFRWEFATAVAGARARSQSVRRTRCARAPRRFTGAQLDAHAETGSLQDRPACSAREPAARRRESPRRAPAAATFVAILDYLPADPSRATTIATASRRHSRAHAARGHTRRRPAVPALDRPVPQGRTEHRPVRAPDVGRRARRRRCPGEAYPSAR